MRTLGRDNKEKRGPQELVAVMSHAVTQHFLCLAVTDCVYSVPPAPVASSSIFEQSVEVDRVSKKNKAVPENDPLAF